MESYLLSYDDQLSLTHLVALTEMVHSLAARKSGKRAFLVMDQVVYRNTRPPDDHNLNHDNPNGL